MPHKIPGSGAEPQGLCTLTSPPLPPTVAVSFPVLFRNDPMHHSERILEHRRQSGTSTRSKRGLVQLQTRDKVANIAPIRDRLNEIARRRNLIVHEGALVRHSRAGSIRTNKISSSDVADSIDFLDEFVEHLEAVR